MFVTLTYPQELTNKNKLYFNDKVISNGIEDLTFVAIKNGMPSKDVYMFNNFEKKSEVLDVKQIFFFLKKYFKVKL